MVEARSIANDGHTLETVAIDGTGYELARTQEHPYGVIRSRSDPALKFSTTNAATGQDAGLKEKIFRFIIEYVQRQMVESHGLSEVWIPEDGVGQQKSAKCNIFMSPEFRLDADREANRSRKAVVLI